MMPVHHARLPMIALVASALFIAGCSTPVPISDKKDVPVETRSGTPAGQGAGAAGAAAPQSQVTTVTTANDGVASAPRIVYFDFDSFTIKDEFRPVVETSAKQLTVNRTRRITIEGHTDERGGREYNLALGQKRAESVAKALALLGVNENQLEAVSFGKERPAAPGSDEAAWAKNRRAEIKDK